ncbi:MULTISPECIES: hypothetical protein [Chlorogloeopsis]|uniref:hypothetical protein n=1 Tax=Chlorogloeopsis TaxID=1123 RepID=UPI0019F616B4|nr:hypothetical protein [Chlorogloeopsis fritschii]MBF2006688.1 hypothetical protein [Chlorogloeopsis fritschii C42_A2020_084]
MNTQLVEALAQIIQSLSQEERALLEEKLKKLDGRAAFERLIELGNKINARRGGKPFDPPLEDYIRQTREERNEQHDELIRNCFPKSEVK